MIFVILSLNRFLTIIGKQISRGIQKIDEKNLFDASNCEFIRFLIAYIDTLE